MRQYRLLIACALFTLLVACGGGGSSTGNGAGIVPGAPTSSHAPSEPTSSPLETASPSPSPSTTSAPVPSAARIPSTVGRIGLAQMFDYHDGYMPQAEVDAYGRRFDLVWASLSPTEWDSAHPGMIVSDYYIMGLDQYAATNHSLAWFQANHPDWIFYACTPSGQPTHDIAYMNGIDVPDVPLDIHNSQAVAYQVSSMAGTAKAAGYDALAVDQVVFENIYHGGNDHLGQVRHPAEYGCGSWHGSTFERDYASPTDPQYALDVVAYVRQAHSILRGAGMTLVVNHPAGSLSNPDEAQLVGNTDVDVNETGFSDYGHFQRNSGLIGETIAWSQYAQEHGVTVVDVDKFININGPVEGQPLEYSIATYLLANEGAELLFVGGLHGYGTIQLHPEYEAQIGTPCAEVTAGPVYTRRFSSGFVAVNATSTPTSVALPSGKPYRDIDSASTSSTLTLQPMSGRVLLTSSSGCT